MKKGQQNIIVSFFIAVLVAVMLVVVAGDFVTNQNTTKTNNENNLEIVSNDSNAFTNLAFNDLVSSSEAVTIFNGTTLVKDTNYIMNYPSGRINITSGMGNRTDTSNIINISYSYFPAGYVKNNTTRLLLLLIPVFIIIALIAFIAIKITLKES